MSKKFRTPVIADTATPAALIPKHLTKQEFGRRLYSLMMAKGWHQSELARQSGVPRDAVSNYVRGRFAPSPKNLALLAEALNVEPSELFPNHTEMAIDEENPSFEMKTSVATPGMAWVRVNRLVSTATAIKIADLLENDRAVDREGSSGQAKV